MINRSEPTASEAVLGLDREFALDPAQIIIDAHHHLYHRPGVKYLFEDFHKDVSSCHDIRATVFVQARSMLRKTGPEPFKPVGETEFANGIAAMYASGLYGPVRGCAAIVGFADLNLGDGVRPVLEAHVAAAGGPAGAGGRFRGIRHVAAWDRDASLLNPVYPTTEHMLESPAFRRGFGHLSALGLSFDAWILFPQIRRLAALARAFPDTAIILNHCGGIACSGAYQGRNDEVFAHWKSGLIELADCPNVRLKLGGLGMPLSGIGPAPLGGIERSELLAVAWRPWMETCIDIFGTARCMFESNFPADRISHDYVAAWNALKRIAANASPDEKSDLFWRTASTAYRISLPCATVPMNQGSDSSQVIAAPSPAISVNPNCTKA